MSATRNPFQSLSDAIAFSSADWGQARDMAWIYGIVLGWDDEDDEDDGAMGELAIRFGWDASTVERLRALHAEFQRAAGVYSPPEEA